MPPSPSPMYLVCQGAEQRSHYAPLLSYTEWPHSEVLSSSRDGRTFIRQRAVAIGSGRLAMRLRGASIDMVGFFIREHETLSDE